MTDWDLIATAMSEERSMLLGLLHKERFVRAAVERELELCQAMLYRLTGSTSRDVRKESGHE